MSTLIATFLLGCTRGDAPGLGEAETCTSTGASSSSSSPRPDEGEWTASVGDLPAHTLVLRGKLADAASVEARCVAEGDPAEAHRAAADAAVDHTLTFVGLLPATTYTCTITAGGASAVVEGTTDPAPDWIPDWTVTETEPPWGSYVLMSHGIGGADDESMQKLMIVDRAGRLRWHLLAPIAVPDLDSQYLGDGTILFGGGHGIVPTRVDLCGREIWHAPKPSTGKTYHHHVQWTEDDQVVALAHNDETDGVLEWDGFTIETIDVATTATVDVWYSLDAVLAGTLDYPEEDDLADPFHTNALILEPDGDRIFNSYDLGELFSIDGETGDIEWSFGPDGDFALLDDDGEAAPETAWFYKAHAPERNGDTLLLYDNGVGRPGRYSRVVEYELDEAARTARVAWSWTEEGWYTPIWGDVDALPDGDVLVTKTHCWFCAGVDPAGRLEVIQVDRAVGPTWRLTFADAEDAGYRSQMIDGCELFANEQYCADLR